MKVSLNLCFALFCSIALAQSDLFVSNGSYVYVDGTGFTPGPNVAPVFVTNDVNIEGGGHIYLRNEGQLLQGDDAVFNSGEGNLSVYQNSDVNQFAYHYWCSPVGEPLNSSTDNEPFSISQIHDPLVATANPIDSGAAAFTTALNGTPNTTNNTPILTISSSWLYNFIASDDYSEWVPLTETSPISIGLGFTMKGMGPFGGTVNQTYDFRGKPNTGRIESPILDGQWTLIGNPYPSAIDAAEFLHDPENVNLDEVSAPPAGTTGAIYYWEQDPANSDSHFIENYVGGYASFTCTAPDGSDNVVISRVAAPYNFHLPDGSVAATPPVGTGARVAERYIPIGQGFMVEGAAGILPDSFVVVKNEHREFMTEASGNSFFFRGSPDMEQTENDSSADDDESDTVPSDYKRFRIIVSFNELYSRELLANFHDSATDGFDYGLEAKMPTSIPSDAHWTQEDGDYVIQAHAFSEDLRIPIVVKVESAQPLAFGIYDVQNFEENQGIYIYDSNYDQYINLKENNYFLNIQPGHYPNRFEIVFSTDDLLSNEETALDRLMIVQNNKQGQLQIFNPSGLDISGVELFDVSGRLVIITAPSAIQSQYNISTQDLSDGVYVVNIRTGSDAVKTEKVIVKN